MKAAGAKRISLNLILPVILFMTASFLFLAGMLWNYLSPAAIRLLLLTSGILIFLPAFFMERRRKRQQADFANEICASLDALMDGREPEDYAPYEDSQISKVQERLLGYYELVQESRRQSEDDKQNIQELVSDISHQVKTPVANLLMFTDILKRHELSAEKRAEFLATMEAQVEKLDFLMQSLIKMSRLEAGTFALHMETGSLHETIAQAVSGVWTKAAQKNISIDVQCDSQMTVNHDVKWTAEALFNLLDNAVKYTPEGGNIRVSVRPWQFFTRIDISDTGMGIAAGHYHDVFKRFYRAQEAANTEGVGLGLYLARGIITRQKGYISVKSEIGKGTTFSVFLLN